MKQATILVSAFIFLSLAFGISANGQVEGGAIAAIDEPSEGGGGGYTASRPSSPAAKKTVRRPVKGAPAAARTVAVRPKPRRWDGFVIGDKYTFMNFEVISAEKPYHTRDAKAGGAFGLVQVEILIETNGSVIAARARTGNKLLHPEAERAALASKFNRPSVYGKPARATGFLVYRFGREENE